MCNLAGARQIAPSLRRLRVTIWSGGLEVVAHEILDILLAGVRSTH